MIHMSDDPTNDELSKKIEILEQELDELQSKLNEVLNIKQACKDMAQKLATERGEALADWWWVV